MTAHPTISNRELLASCWTSAGNAAPDRGDEVSPVDLRTRIETVAAVGIDSDPPVLSSSVSRLLRAYVSYWPAVA